ITARPPPRPSPAGGGGSPCGEKTTASRRGREELRASRPDRARSPAEVDLEGLGRVLLVEAHVAELGAARDLAEEILEELVEAVALAHGRLEARGLEQVDVLQRLERLHEGVEALVVVRAHE